MIHDNLSHRPPLAYKLVLIAMAAYAHVTHMKFDTLLFSKSFSLNHVVPFYAPEWLKSLRRPYYELSKLLHDDEEALEPSTGDLPLGAERGCRAAAPGHC